MLTALSTFLTLSQHFLIIQLYEENLHASLIKAAAQRIYSILPEDQGRKMLELWQEFERGESAEACFAKVLDKVQPIMLSPLIIHLKLFFKVIKRNEKYEWSKIIS